jgi:RNA polymerase sigma factor (sigma-70 family)
MHAWPSHPWRGDLIFPLAPGSGESPFTDRFNVDRFLRGEPEECNRALKMALDFLSWSYPQSLGFHDREDTSQEALRQAIRHLQGGEPLENDFSVWFRSVVNHRAIEHLRKKNGNQKLRLIPYLESEAKLPRRGTFLVVVALVRHLLHFRVFNRGGLMSHDANEVMLPEQAREMQELRDRLERLWPPPRPSRKEANDVIAAVRSILGIRPEMVIVPEDPVDRDPLAEDRAIHAEAIIRLKASLQSLTPEQFEVVTKHVFEGYSLRECSRLMNISQTMAQRLWHESLRQLRVMLGDSLP